MLSDVAKGLLAGAAGTVALNVTTYADMAVRGRASSHVPGEDVNVLLHDLGIELPDEEHRPVAYGHHAHEHHDQERHHHAHLGGGSYRERLVQGYASAHKWPRSKVAQDRLTGLGALTGYAVGLGIGSAYGILRPRLRALPTPIMGVLVGLAAMAGSDVPSILLGVTNPRTWGLAGWIEDIIPHVIYGVTTVGVYEALHAAEQPKRSWWPW